MQIDDELRHEIGHGMAEALVATMDGVRCVLVPLFLALVESGALTRASALGVVDDAANAASVSHDRNPKAGQLTTLMVSLVRSNLRARLGA